MPSRKWIATQITALTGWAIAFVNVHAHWTDTIIIALITIGSQAAIGWLIPNDPAQAGVKGQAGQP
jgi:hypothetical protein